MPGEKICKLWYLETPLASSYSQWIRLLGRSIKIKLRCLGFLQYIGNPTQAAYMSRIPTVHRKSYTGSIHFPGRFRTQGLQPRTHCAWRKISACVQVFVLYLMARSFTSAIAMLSWTQKEIRQVPSRGIGSMCESEHVAVSDLRSSALHLRVLSAFWNNKDVRQSK